MRFQIHPRHKPLLVAVIIAGLAYGVYVAEAIVGEPDVTDCCATEFDPTPYQQIPLGASEPLP